jgi:hypothetical protein
MPRVRNPRLYVAAFVLGCTAFLSRAVVTPTEGSASDRDGGDGRPFKWQGVASCSASACHGMAGPGGMPGCEYTAWISCDPHARAFSTLYDLPSLQILQRLKKSASPDKAHPEREELCLKCHAMAVPADLRGPRFTLADGVGCESCHGPAESWLPDHLLPGWKTKGLLEKAALGMRPTKSLPERARVCAGCHVGGADREVNHDLLAAGHPRLNFEFGTYLANLPKHWQENKANAVPDFEARVWAVGQVVSLRAALDLLAARAARTSAAPDAAPWPEFAEYECSACHHNLRDEEWRRPARGKRGVSAYRWGGWYTALPPLLAGQWPDKHTDQTVETLEDLIDLMNQAAPDRQEVAEKAGRLAGELEPWAQSLATKDFSADALRRLLQQLARDERGLAGKGWDPSAQIYLAAVALNQVRLATDPRPDKGAVERQLWNVYKQLRTDRDAASPGGFDGERFRDQWNRLKALFGE